MLDLLETTPFDQITLRDLAATAGIGYTTFFRHHPTKEALLQEIAADQIRRLVSLVLPMLEMSDTRPASIALCRYVDDHRRLWSTLLTGGAAGVLREEFLKVSTEVASGWPRTGALQPSEIVIILVVSSTIELLAWWLRQKKPLSVERIAEIHERLIISPAINPRGRGKPTKSRRGAPRQARMR
ncbi:MAG TPA: TetR/AcrR family transcriptional regulator [Steroidobacteraceae bacterium]|nr:TetR/AcrR family transcriptional regulator [Steroidobacteraceae bacterium]